MKENYELISCQNFFTLFVLFSNQDLETQHTLLLKLKEVALNTPEDFFCDYVRGRCVD